MELLPTKAPIHSSVTVDTSWRKAWARASMEERMPLCALQWLVKHLEDYI